MTPHKPGDVNKTAFVMSRVVHKDLITFKTWTKKQGLQKRYELFISSPNFVWFFGLFIILLLILSRFYIISSTKFHRSLEDRSLVKGNKPL